MQRAFSPLKRQILIRLMLAAGLLSALLLVVFLMAYRSQMVNAGARTSMGFNLLLQAALENAMLKRDVPGLADIVERLGKQPGIRNVMILNPQGEVRFASSPGQVGRELPHLVPAPDAPPSSEFIDGEDVDVLRSINSVRNQPACQQCHGTMTEHPVNGILLVDYDAGDIRTQSMENALALSAAGFGMLALIMGILWRSLNTQVLRPVAALTEASATLEQGELGKRVHLAGNDEFAQLGLRFNSMAERIETQMAAIQAHQAYLQDILDGLPDGVRVIRQSDMAVVLANRAFCEQVGRPVEEVLSQACYWSSHGRTAPCIPTMVTCPVAELKTSGTSIKFVQHQQRADGHPEGKQFPAEIHAILIELENGAGRHRYIVESVRDLGQSMQISQEQRLTELGVLAAGIAHEIHNPLGSVRLGVQGLLREIQEGHASHDKILEYLGLIDQEIDKCIAVTRRLLLLARPPSASLMLVEINEALSDTLSLLEYDAQSRRITQKLEQPAESLRLFADEAELRMIFLNLLQNAHHAMPEGGLLHVRLARDGTHAVVEITDNGVGMSAEAVKRIFDPFFSQRADRVVGTGLGLTIVKNFVERMQGSISVSSTEGKGSTFTLRLPLIEDTPLPHSTS